MRGFRVFFEVGDNNTRKTRLSTCFPRKCSLTSIFKELFMPRFVPKINNPTMQDRIYILDLPCPKGVQVWIEDTPPGNGVSQGYRIRCGNGVKVRLNENLVEAANEALRQFPGFSDDITTFAGLLDLLCVTRGRIAASRKAAGLTQDQAAALVHAATRTWQDWEYGAREMPMAQWELWCIKVAALAAASSSRTLPPL